ncbi:VOC family protein [Nocardioides sp. T2.26MG-1]|uniref:VOC family protein n=1 Tax=Nocardioides sp. T2.26MG-1 TaxID=3041166 RepID=UPI002477842A|nr:VOC family protein [Nocardioides sp. T2.26MG-1]CAI9418697.1 Putative pterin-4-alpha-carbinolamine dehydratase [Nocardioides sp. T2.26MG-1]
MSDLGNSEQNDQTVLSYERVKEEKLGHWRWLVGGLHARFATGDFKTGLALVDEIGAAAEAAGHHPDLDLRYSFLAVRLVSHDAGGVTGRDLRLAARISELAARAGVRAAPEDLQVLELGLDTADHTRIVPFWRALLGYDDSPVHGDKEVVDAGGRQITLWFQETQPHETPRQRFHVDVVVPIEQARARIDAALEAGGTLVTDEHAPAFWVLADADGNHACVCTPEARSKQGS